MYKDGVPDEGAHDFFLVWKNSGREDFTEEKSLFFETLKVYDFQRCNPSGAW